MKSPSETVTVVIPVYNSEKFLAKALDSILNQTYKNLEIIVINDGSIDHSLDILSNYANKIKVISQPNKGLASALNLGISKSNGKWLKWFSPDDVLYPNAIETLVNEANKLPENTILYSNWEIIDENDNKLRYFSESNFNDLGNFDFSVRLLDTQQINVNTTLIPLFLFERGCKIQKLKDPVTIDYDFFLQAGILYDTSFHLIPKPLLKYRIHTDQLSHKNIVNSLSCLSEVKNQILSKLDNSKKDQYQTALLEYNKKKSITKKTMETSLKIAINTLPKCITNRLITFYLNKIRRSR